MTDVFSRLSGLDRLIHSPPRLAILTALRGCQSADFMFLQSLTGLTRGNLSAHLRKLEEARLIHVRKGFKGRRPHTSVALSEKGRECIDEHWKQLDALRDDALRWEDEEECGAEVSLAKSVWGEMFERPLVCLTSDQDWAPPWAAQRLVEAAARRGFPLHVFRTNPCPVFDQALEDGSVTAGWHPNFLPGSSHGETPGEVIEHMERLVPGANTARSHCFYEHSAAWQGLAEAGIRVDSQVCTQWQRGIEPLLHFTGIVRCPVFFEDDVFFAAAAPDLSLDSVLTNLSTPGLKILNVHATFFGCNTPSNEHYQAVRDRVFGSEDPAEGVVFDGRGTRVVVEELLEAITEAAIEVESFSSLANRLWAHIGENPARFPHPFGTA